MHELLFYELFGSSSTLIYIGIILVSFSVASSASWKNIGGAILKSWPLKERASKVAKREKTKPEIISSKTSVPQETSSSEKPQKLEKPKKQEKSDKPKKQDKPQKEQSSNLFKAGLIGGCLLYTSPSPRDRQKSRMPSSA